MMDIQTFIPPRAPDGGTTDKPEFKVLSADFGDGYSQEAPDGINPIRRVLTLTWSFLHPGQAAPIVVFIKAQQGASAFLYTPSDETEPVKWTCKDYTDRREDGGLRTVTLGLRECFNLAD